MDLIKASALKADFLTKPPNGIPMILLEPNLRTLRKLHDAGYVELSLSRELTSILIALPAEQRASAVMQETRKLIRKKGPLVLIRDYEILFDPVYQLDVLKLFCELARYIRIAVIWCGTHHDNVLEFAEPGYPDFQSYRTDLYTIYCIQ